MTARILVVQPVRHAPVGRLGQWWASAGIGLDVVSPPDGDAVPAPDAALAHWDAVVVMGGPMGANDDADFPWLADVKRLLATTSALGLPTLGVCLGHQLLAVACGGRVVPNDAGIQAGLRPVGLMRGVEADPLHGGLGPDPVAVQWNSDIVVETPPGVTVLAATPEGVPQAIRAGSRSWGVQFHPEVVMDTVRDWAARDVRDGSMRAEVAGPLLAQIELADAELVACWRPWAQRFAAIVTEYAAGRVRNVNGDQGTSRTVPSRSATIRPESYGPET